MVVPPVFCVVNSTDVVSPLQIIWSWESSTWAVGFTVIVNVSSGPSQLIPSLVYIGVAVIVAVTGEVLLLTAVNEAISPLPVAAKPILGVSFTHEYVVVPPVFSVLNAMAAVSSALHSIWLSTSSTWLEGFTVIVNVWESPSLLIPPFSKVGVTVTVATMGDKPLFTAVKVGKSPEPESAKPIPGVSLVHSNVVLPPEFALSKSTLTSSPLHTTWSSIDSMVTGGLMVMVYSSKSASQSTPSRTGVIVYVRTNGPEVSFTNVSDGIWFDVPLDCDKPIRFPVGSFADQL